MKIQIDDIWCEELGESRKGLPEDVHDFDLPINVVISAAGQISRKRPFFRLISRNDQYMHQCFCFRVISPSRLGQLDNLCFIRNTMVLYEFDWESITGRLNKLFMHTNDCKDWDCVIEKLAGCLEYRCDW